MSVSASVTAGSPTSLHSSITHSLTDTYIRPSLRNSLEIPQSFIPQHMLLFNVHHALDTLGIFDDVRWVILTLRSRWIRLSEYSTVVTVLEPISISAHFEHCYAILFLTTGSKECTQGRQFVWNDCFLYSQLFMRCAVPPFLLHLVLHLHVSILRLSNAPLSNV